MARFSETTCHTRNIHKQLEAVADGVFSDVAFLSTIVRLAQSTDTNSESLLESIRYLSQKHASTLFDTLNALVAISDSVAALFPPDQALSDTSQSLVADKNLLRTFFKNPRC